MKKIILLGASGSIGSQTQQVVRTHPNAYCLSAIAVQRNIDVAEQIIREFGVKHVCVFEEAAANTLAARLQAAAITVELYTGINGLTQLVHCDGDVVVNALVGSIGVRPTVEAIKLHKTIALANKETLVTAGSYVMPLLQQSRAKILPVDSEHSAIFQCLEANYQKSMKQIILTASGGSLRDHPAAALMDVTVEEVLRHPNWSMGQKITVDCATMMNKGFEVIEARWLFDIPYEQIHVVLHKQSLVHSMVEYVDGSILAHLGQSDMRIPIQYALTYPAREQLQPSTAFDWSKLYQFDFAPVEEARYPALKLAYDVGIAGGTYAAALNAANEVAVAAFLQREIAFPTIVDICLEMVDQHQSITDATLEEILAVDQAVRLATVERVKQHSR